MADELTPATFAPHTGTPFTSATGTVFVLDTVTPLPRHGSPRQEPFSLVFVTLDAPLQPQQVHDLEHDALGHLSVFLVPIGPDGAGRMRYEAVFN